MIYKKFLTVLLIKKKLFTISFLFAIILDFKTIITLIVFISYLAIFLSVFIIKKAIYWNLIIDFVKKNIKISLLFLFRDCKRFLEIKIFLKSKSLLKHTNKNHQKYKNPLNTIQNCFFKEYFYFFYVIKLLIVYDFKLKFFSYFPYYFWIKK